MKVLFEHVTPKPIARSLIGRHVRYARQIGWHDLENGELIQEAEDAGFDVLLRTGKIIRYQQNISNRKSLWSRSAIHNGHKFACIILD